MSNFCPSKIYNLVPREALEIQKNATQQHNIQSETLVQRSEEWARCNHSRELAKDRQQWQELKTNMVEEVTFKIKQEVHKKYLDFMVRAASTCVH